MFGIKDRLYVGMFRQPVGQSFRGLIDDSVAFDKVGTVAENGVGVLTVQPKVVFSFIVVDVVG